MIVPLESSAKAAGERLWSLPMRALPPPPPPPYSKGRTMRIAACLSLMILATGAAAQTPAGSVDYDLDDNNLIDVRTSTQLQAITHDLAGVGNASTPAYGIAFPDAVQGMGCPSTCTGYELQNDIDLSGRNWVPIGYLQSPTTQFPPASQRYSAVFEGNGYIIRNLHMNVPFWYTGLFRALGDGGVIRNVGLVNVDVSAPINVGALVGPNFGKVAACYVVGGTVTGVHPSFGGSAGGLAGSNGGTIVASYANVTVRVGGSFSVAGGLVYNNSGKVIASYSSSLFAGGENAGGLVGVHSRLNPGEIENSYFDGNRSTWGNGLGVLATTRKTSRDLRTPTTAVGIYAGWDQLNVDDTTGTVMGVRTLNDDAPWDFGSGFDYPVLRGISARFPTGNPTNIGEQRRLQPPVLATLSQRGGTLVAEGSTATYAVELDAGRGGVVTMTWSVEATGVGGGHAEAADFVATQGRVVLINTNSAVFGVRIARDGTTEPRETFRVRLSNPQSLSNVRLSAASSAVVSVIGQGGNDYDPDDNNLINVATTSQLAAIGYDLGGTGRFGVSTGNLSAYDEAFPAFDEAGCPGGCQGYELSNDVDLSSVASWTPIGDGGSPTAYYTAVLEGNGYVISNLRIDRPSARLDNAGLFGAVGGAGTIRNVGLVDVNIHVGSGSVSAGALVGVNYGRVAASYATGGRVEGVSATGGLAGANHGTVIASYANVEVHANAHRSGGLIGRAFEGSVVSASYSIGMVTGGTRDGSTLRGGLLGGRDETDAAEYDVQASYFDRGRSGQSACCGENVPSPDEAPKTSDALRAPTTAVGTIYAGWDRLDVDGVDQGGDRDFNDDAPWDFGSDLDYPVLRGVGARYPTGNGANIRVQRNLQPPPSVTLSQRGDALVVEGSTATYAVELGRRSTAVVMVSWSVELAGVGTGHAVAADFVGTTRGTVTLVNTASAVFGVRIARDQTPERRETFRVRLSDLQGPENLSLSVASSAVVSVIGQSGTDFDLDDKQPDRSCDDVAADGDRL